jgi:uncharacterized membrane protein HdeD (DUF308 family)
LLGLFVLFFPQLATTSIALVFGLFAMAYGLMTIIGSIWLINGKNKGWSLWFLEGLFGLLIGIVAVTYPVKTTSILVILMGLWAIITGMLTLISYYKMRSILPFRGNLPFVSILSILIGMIILLNPFQSAVVILVLIGIYAITFSIFSIFQSLKPYPDQ